MRKLLISGLLLGTLALVLSPSSQAMPIYALTMDGPQFDAPDVSLFSTFNVEPSGTFQTEGPGQMNFNYIFSMYEVTYTPTYQPVAPTPEPASLFLLGTGLLGVGAWFRRSRIGA